MDSPRDKFCKDWREALLPWLDAIRLSAGGALWTGFDLLESRTDLEREEGPITVRSVSWGERPAFRRTLAFCSEYALDLASVVGSRVQSMAWTLKTSRLHAIQPPALPRPGVSLPLEARWIVEWRAPSGLTVKTTGESARGTAAKWEWQSEPRCERWRIERNGANAFFSVCHEPAEKPKVQATFTLSQNHRYTVRVIGDGFFDYWMLDPAHTPAPFQLKGERVEIGTGWGYVRLENGKETSFGALRRDWG